MMAFLAIVSMGIAIIGSALALYMTRLVRTTTDDCPSSLPGPWPAVTLLKPLHQAEPDLYENLLSFLMQDYPGDVQMVVGVGAASDAALGIAQQLQRDFPSRDIEIVVGDGAVEGNAKVANLVTMSTKLRHEVVVLSDSDMRVGRNYLRQVVTSLGRPQVGLVTCLYRGESAIGFWSLLSSMAIDFHFFPTVLLGIHLQKARPCIGATIALKRSMLLTIGGFRAFAHVLADDYAIGEAVRATGQLVLVDRTALVHRCTERTATELVLHELRWARTLRSIDPAGFAGSFVTNPLPFAIIAATLTGFDAWGLATIALTVVCRALLQRQIEVRHCIRTRRWLLTPVRDLLSLAVFCWSFIGTEVVWQGRRYRILRDGALKQRLA